MSAGAAAAARFLEIQGAADSALAGWRPLNGSPDGLGVFELSLSNRPSVVAKYYSDGSGERVHELLLRLRQWPAAVLRVPEPIAYDPRLRVLFTARAGGRPCVGLDVESCPDTMRRIGRALHELHTIPVGAARATTSQDYLRELIRPRPFALAEAMPEYGPAIERVLEEAAGLDRLAATIAPSLIHRDFHLRQLFDDGERITVVDWDLASAGDPAFDVAFLSAYLQTHYDGRTAEKGRRAFFEGYSPSGPLMQRVRVYERFNFLRRACRRYRLKDGDWKKQIDQMFEFLEA